jgi:uncharacterized repeat protein (TIGR01451 family)
MRPSASLRRLALALLAACASALAPAPRLAPSFAASSTLVISQVYGGGGNSGAPYQNDFVELFNLGSAPVALAGWSLQYASAAGTSWQVTPLSGFLAPGQYLLVRQAAGNSCSGPCGQPLPAADLTGAVNLNATAGKLALVNGTAALAGACPTVGVVDFVGYGGANCAEAEAARSPSNTTALLRAQAGCADTDDNAADFETGPPAPRNSAASPNVCFEAALVLDKSGPPAASPGALVTYTLSLANLGNVVAAATTLTDTLPAGAAFITYTASLPHAFSQPQPGVLVWDLGDLPLAAQAAITLQAALPLTLPVGAWLTNTAAASTTAFETGLLDNAAQAATLLGAPNLALGHAGPAAPVLPSDPLTFTLAYTNTGDLALPGVALTSTLPAALAYAADSAGGLHSGGVITWALGTLGVEQGGAVVLTATALFAGVFTPTATLAAGLPETTLADNTAPAPVTVLGADPYAALAGPAALPLGQRLTYTIGYGNHGPLSTPAALTLSLPAGFNPGDIAFDGSGLPFADGAGARAWDAGALLGHAHLTFTLALTLPAGLSAGATLTGAILLDADAVGDDPANNSAPWATLLLPPDPCALDYTPIPALQGAGDLSPFAGQAVTTRGIVTADFQASPGLGGYFLQDEHGDGDPATSDGLFVFNTNFPVSLGDLIVISATVQEFNTLTELSAITAVTLCGAGHALAPTVLALPVPAPGGHERYEGMLVTLPQPLTAAQNYFLGRYGQVILAAGGRLFHPNSGNALGEDPDLNLRRMLVLDDGRNAQNPNPIPYLGPDNTLRAGDVVSGLTGVLDFGPISSITSVRFYRLHPTQPLAFTRLNARPAAPPAVGGSLRLAGVNVLNYFNGDGLGGGFPTSRGASSPLEFERQRAKLIALLAALDADVVGLMEIENDGAGSLSAVQDLVNGLNAAVAPGAYAFVVEPAPGSDQIKLALLYRPARVTPVGAALNYQATAPPAYPGPLFERPPLAQTFRQNDTGAVFTVVVNHFKSKSCGSASGPDADLGQGCWNARRTAQAAALLDFVALLQAASGDPDVIVLGDLNAYGLEDPLLALASGGLVNQAARVPAPERYSYIFDGSSGYLDHALTTPSLDPHVTAAAFWHVNADEPSVLDYNTEFKPHDLYAPDPYRASDHDPILLGLDLPPPGLRLFLALIARR